MNKIETTRIHKITCAADSNGLKATGLKKIETGGIRASGWLRTQLELMAEGMTGRLPEYGPFFRPDKNGFLYPEANSGWEEIPYWLRGYFPLAVQLGDKRMLAMCQLYFESLISSQREDGWFGPLCLRDNVRLDDGEYAPDLMPYAFLIDTFIMYYEYSGDKRALELIEKFFRFCAGIPEKCFMIPKLSRIKWARIRSGAFLPDIYWYYEKTGEEWLLTLAKRFYDNIWECEFPFIANHGVAFAERVSYSAVYSRQSGKQSDFDSSERAYTDFMSVWGQMPRGAFAADEQVREGCTDPRQGIEPCAIVELAKSFYEMGRISGGTVYADRIEDIMLNHFPASFSENYQQMHYITCCNLPELNPAFYQPSRNGVMSPVKSFEIMTPNNRCCGHNAGMGWPYYTENLWQKTHDGGLAAYIYAGCEVDTEINGSGFALSTITDYPFRGTVTVRVRQNDCGGTPLYFRLPGWAKSAVISVNGERQYESDTAGGFIRLTADWKPEDIISLEFGMATELHRYESSGGCSVDRGPLTYSLKLPEIWEIVADEDAGGYRHPNPHIFENYSVRTDAPWNYALCAGLPIELAYEAENIAAQPFSVKNAPIVLRAQARRIPEWGLEDHMAGELQPSPAYTDEPVETVELIPLGCARLRISCFPTVGDSPDSVKWTKTPAHVDIENRAKDYPNPYKEFVKQ